MPTQGESGVLYVTLMYSASGRRSNADRMPAATSDHPTSRFRTRLGKRVAVGRKRKLVADLSRRSHRR